jgi:anaerobic ribonucleoside-triphosphate reductase
MRFWFLRNIYRKENERTNKGFRKINCGKLDVAVTQRGIKVKGKCERGIKWARSKIRVIADKIKVTYQEMDMAVIQRGLKVSKL